MATSNDKITMKGNPLKVMGAPVTVGEKAPNFKLTGVDMQDLELKDFAGKKLIVCAVPSVDTPVCQTETRAFNEKASVLGDDVEVLFVSMDLPFAQKRWCGAENLSNIKTASDFKYRGFGESYGVYLPDLGLLARAVFVIDASGTVTYVDYVSEVAEEPNYEAVFSSIA
ncbi:MAG: thiol peroxidase [Bdellovibrionales bacterium]|nr:thiol peroxidase [Bdellovibrionales bacterium]